MNLATTLSLQAGGVGSGCNPSVGKCGRPPSDLYHGTSMEAIKKIMKEGLKPTGGRLFMTRDLGEAKSYGAQSHVGENAFEKTGRFVIVTVSRADAEKLGFKVAAVDRFGGRTGSRVWSTNKVVPPEMLSKIDVYQAGKVTATYSPGVKIKGKDVGGKKFSYYDSEGGAKRVSSLKSEQDDDVVYFVVPLD